MTKRERERESDRHHGRQAELGVLPPQPRGA